MHPGAARHSTRASLGLVGSTGPLLHSRRDCKMHTKAGFPTRAAERREMLWARRVQGSAGRLSCTLEWSERSTRDWPKLRIIEARALVLLLVAGEQSPADYRQFSAFLAVDTHRQASVQPRKKLRYNLKLIYKAL